MKSDRSRYAKCLMIVLPLMLASASFANDDSFDNKLTGDWNGVRKQLQQRGIEIGVNWQPEWFANFQGGIQRGIRGASTLDINATLDTEKLIGWKQGKLYIDFEHHAGSNPSHVLIRDLQVFDQFNYTPYFQIFEFWYEQTFWNDKLRLKLGKVDANTEFSGIENALSFLNSSTQVTPTVLSFPTTPAPVLSGNIFFTPIKSWYLSLGAYAANRHNRFGVYDGDPEDALITHNGTLLLSETGIKWSNTSNFKTGNFKLGFWKHTGSFTRIEGGTQQGANGYYTIFNQTFWQPTGALEDGKGLRGFFSYGHTQESVGIIPWNVTTGFTWTGLFPNRAEDILGVSANYAHIQHEASKTYPYELAYELNYKVHVYKGISLLPDLQYIIHPGGQYPSALVGTLHMAIDL